MMGMKKMQKGNQVGFRVIIASKKQMADSEQCHHYFVEFLLLLIKMTNKRNATPLISVFKNWKAVM